METIARSVVNPIPRPISHPQKTMMMIFFGVNNIAFIDMLPKKPV
jgi:hypothetical protein